MKWIIGIFSLVIIFAIFSGYTGGASKLGENYHKVMRTPK